MDDPQTGEEPNISTEEIIIVISAVVGGVVLIIGSGIIWWWVRRRRYSPKLQFDEINTVEMYD